MPGEMPHVTIYTDGGCAPNPGPGGWAALLIAANGVTRDLSGAEPQTTNNRMELTAALEALRKLKQPCQVTLHTDSEYLKRGITEWLPDWAARGWQRKGKRPIENEDLWRALHTEMQRHTITWQWVRGHAGDPHNEHVDRLATAARERLVAQQGSSADVQQPNWEIALRVSLPRGARAGGWAARVRDLAGEKQIVLTGRASVNSANQLWLVAACAVLKSLPEGATVRLHAPDSYLIQSITRWVAGWRARGWQTKEGSAVKHRADWEALAAAAERRRVQWVQEGSDQSPLAEGLAALAAEAARDA
ncbi:MAG: ribonuclease HI [Anaerolineae bacterium]|nr:ribonuclease HI [Anaerolineae bacterium]